MKFFLLTILSITIFNFCQAQTIVPLANTMWTKKGIHPSPPKTIAVPDNFSICRQFSTEGISFTDSTFEWTELHPISNTIKGEETNKFYRVSKVLNENTEEIEVWNIRKKKKVSSFKLKITFLSENKIKVEGAYITTRKHKIILQKI